MIRVTRLPRRRCSVPPSFRAHIQRIVTTWQVLPCSALQQFSCDAITPVSAKVAPMLAREAQSAEIWLGRLNFHPSICQFSGRWATMRSVHAFGYGPMVKRIQGYLT